MVFLIVSLVVFYAAAIFMPKKISWLQIWSASLLSLVLETLSDMTLDFKLNLFGYFGPGNQWAGYLAVFIYAPVNAIFLNYFPYNRSLMRKLVYLILWTAFCTVYEVGALKSGFFYYSKWKLWYSVLCYPVLLLTMLCNYRFTEWLHRRAKD